MIEMNKFKKKYLPIMAAMAVSVAACNDIDSDERFIELPPIEGNRVVLIEDYTGQGCPNCPKGQRIIKQLEGQYPGKVVAVSIHAGEFAISAPRGLKPDFGDAMSSARGVSIYPSGIIDGVGPIAETDNWAAAVREAMSNPALCEISIGDFSFSEDSRQLSGTVTILPGGKFVAANLGIWILESGIVARQYNVDDNHKWDMSYVHDHVMRAYATSSVWGDAISLTRDEEATRNFSVTLDPTWNVENISVVAFVTDASTGEYLQTAQSHISLTTEQN